MNTVNFKKAETEEVLGTVNLPVISEKFDSWSYSAVAFMTALLAWEYQTRVISVVGADNILHDFGPQAAVYIFGAMLKLPAEDK